MVVIEEGTLIACSSPDTAGEMLGLFNVNRTRFVASFRWAGISSGDPTSPKPHNQSKVTTYDHGRMFSAGGRACEFRSERCDVWGLEVVK